MKIHELFWSESDWSAWYTDGHVDPAEFLEAVKAHLNGEYDNDSADSCTPDQVRQGYARWEDPTEDDVSRWGDPLVKRFKEVERHSLGAFPVTIVDCPI